MLAPSRIAWASWKSSASAALVAARSASHISFRPSKAGAVSQNSSRLLRSCPSVNGTSDFQRIVSWQSGTVGSPSVEPFRPHRNATTLMTTPRPGNERGARCE
uniref:Uncharacterized protein n=1 Tax=Anopheles dirus TaxID=7168 RepID=A0A182N7D0_9DIPT